MSTKHAVLAAILCATLGASTASAQLRPQPNYMQLPGAGEPVLPGRTTVSSVQVAQVKGQWQVTVQYFYTGEPFPAMLLVHESIRSSEAPGDLKEQHVATIVLRRGANTVTHKLLNPNTPGVFYTAERFVARLYHAETGALFPEVQGAEIAQVIRWPEQRVGRVEAAIANGREQDIVREAMALIDTENRSEIQSARTLLQILVERNPRVDSAYVELARVAMKSNWGPAGLREAETLLQSALQIRPGSVDAMILLGYVHSHQKRHAEADALFARAAGSNPPNVWLWTNWGESLAMQGKTDEAIAKYREALKRPQSRESHDRGRRDAYAKLLDAYEAKNDLDAMEQLHAQRNREYPTYGCYAIGYARFLVLDRARPDAGLDVLRQAQIPQCEYGGAREVQGLAHYLLWAGDPARADALHQARAFLPVGPRVFQGLAANERTLGAARKLLATGEKIDVQDDEKFDALGYALRAGESQVAGRLLKLGAKPDAPEGAQGMPAALIPVLSRDAEGIRLMQKAGIDYTKLRFQGTTAVDYARSQGDQELLKLVDPRGGKL